MCDTGYDWETYTAELVNAGLWLPTGVPGVYGRNAEFEAVVTAFEQLITRAAEQQGAESVFFPPIMSRATLTTTGYMQSFPSLCGSIHSFSGSDREHADLIASVEAHGDWSPHLEQTDVTLVPAACYPLYPTLGGSTLESGRLFDLSSYVFRHEPSPDPARMQTFRQKENVKLGTPAEVAAWRDQQMENGMALFETLTLPVKLEVANDPFFGRGGRMLAKNQSAAKLKFEITTQIFPDKPATAIASFNYHEDKFGEAFAIHTSDGNFAHTACLGFGLERVTLALFKAFGLDSAAWPQHVRATLGL